MILRGRMDQVCALYLSIEFADLTYAHIMWFILHIGFIPTCLSSLQHRVGMVDCPYTLSRRWCILWSTFQFLDSCSHVYLLCMCTFEDTMSMEKVSDTSSIVSIHICRHLHFFQYKIMAKGSNWNETLHLLRYSNLGND
jgi:hypothetical protein